MPSYGVLSEILLAGELLVSLIFECSTELKISSLGIIFSTLDINKINDKLSI